LGLKKADLQIFTGIQWGTDQVYEQTINRFCQMNLAWEQLNTQWDVDRPEDLKRLVNEKRYQWHPELKSLLDSMKI
jgi:glycosyltransferase A (GT-A) superfamily protein (DUF2064 family)